MSPLLASAFVGLLICSPLVVSGLFGCAKIKDCGQCVSDVVLGAHPCYWCEIDGGCHDATSLVNPCTPVSASDQCISLRAASRCKKHSESNCYSDSPMKPQQLHISLAGPTGMRVMWKTDKMPLSAMVKYSQDFAADAGISVKSERSIQYLAAQGGHGYHHVAKLDGLTPGTRYQYRIECDGVTSTLRHFDVAPRDLKDAKFLVLADMGYGNAGKSVNTRKRLESLKDMVAMTIIAGDIAYADDSFVHTDRCSLEFCYESVYDHYMVDMENVTDSRPFMTAVGNHESECHSPACIVSDDIKNSLRNFSAYNARFAMPSTESRGVANMWYSFDYASVHFVVLNTETDFSGAEEEHFGDSCGPSNGFSCLPAGHFGRDGQYLSWLEADLKAANTKRFSQPWIVTVGHRPWIMGDYQTGKGTREENPEVKAAHAQLFEKYKVDLFISGHVHSYSRVQPIGNNTGTPTVITGGAGCDEMKFDPAFDHKGATADWEFYVMTNQTQVGLLEATATTLTWKAIYSQSGEVFDLMTLSKPVGFMV